MRKIYKNVLTEGDVDKLSLMSYNYLDWEDGVVKKATDILKKDFPKLKLNSPSYVKIEKQPQGHKPHFDGCEENDNGELVDNHMAWCKYSASILLSKPSSFKGGSFKFLTPPKKSIKRDAYLNMIFYSSGADNEPQKHCVTEHHGGERYVLLMFFAEE